MDMTLWGPLLAWATCRSARMDINHPCPSMLLVRFSTPNRVYCLIGGLFPADKRPGWGAALQPEQNGGLCALKCKYHPYRLKYPWLR